MAFTLEKIHPIETEASNPDECGMRGHLRPWRGGIDVEGGRWASIVVDIWRVSPYQKTKGKMKQNVAHPLLA